MGEWWIIMLVFALVVGLFLIYMYEHDRMLDHHANSDGMVFLLISAWIIYVVGNVTVALEYMAMDEVLPTPKVTYLTAGIVLYFITSFLLGRYNKKEYAYSAAYIAGRVLACIFVIVPAVMDLHPVLVLVCDTVVAYLALWHEWVLYHSRTKLLQFAEMHDPVQEGQDGGLSFESGKDRRAVIRAYRKSLKKDDD